MSATQSIPDTALGFTQSELLILRSQQELSQQPTRGATMVERGRGTSRHSQPSSRAASAASSQSQQNRIVLDPRSLASLQNSLDHLLRRIQDQIIQLENATSDSVASSGNRTSNAISNADDEIKRMKSILKQIDQLEEKLEKVKHVRNTIKQLRARVDAADVKMSKLPPQSRPQHQSSSHHTSSHHSSSNNPMDRYLPNRR